MPFLKSTGSTANNIYMDAARNHLAQQSIVIKEEDEAGLSPLQHEHINVLGYY